MEQDRPGDMSRFRRLQAEHFSRADAAKFWWQTTNSYLARTERELLERVPVRSTDRLLEVGCGEGGNLQLLQSMLQARQTRPQARPRGAVGVDFSREKVVWATRRVSGARFLCADATCLPFRTGSFDVVLCRDVLHHVVEKGKVIGEILRVCRPQGRIVIVEPNGRSPIMRLLGWLVPAERDLVRNSLDRFAPLLDRREVTEPEVLWAQPFPFGRVLFHYRWGLPRLSGWLAGPVLAGERLAGKLIPLDRWAYLVLRTIKRGREQGIEVWNPCA